MACYIVKTRRTTLAQVIRAAGLRPWQPLNKRERKDVARGAGSIQEAQRRIDATEEVKGEESASKKILPGGTFFMCGDLGPHCKEPSCAAPGNLLCDWPMGRGKTCDLPLCDEHGREVGEDRHFCPVHHRMWQAKTAPRGGNPWPPKKGGA